MSTVIFTTTLIKRIRIFSRLGLSYPETLFENGVFLNCLAERELMRMNDISCVLRVQRRGGALNQTDCRGIRFEQNSLQRSLSRV